MMASASELIMMVSEQDRMIDKIEKELYSLKEQSRLIRNKLCENDRKENKAYQQIRVKSFLSDEEIEKLKEHSPIPTMVTGEEAYNARFGSFKKEG